MFPLSLRLRHRRCVVCVHCLRASRSFDFFPGTGYVASLTEFARRPVTVHLRTHHLSLPCRVSVHFLLLRDVERFIVTCDCKIKPWHRFPPSPTASLRLFKRLLALALSALCSASPWYASQPQQAHRPLRLL